jgi:hypothetical protein
MSGSKSSAPDTAPAADPLGLTVYDLTETQASEDQRRTRAGRLKMLAVLLVCAAPVIASYVTYFVIRPDGRTNYGALIQPTRSLPDLTLQSLEGQPVALRSLRGQWLLVAVGPAGCDAKCEQRLYAQRQLREMLGRERDRLDKIWLVTDDGAPKPALRDAVLAEPPVTVLRFPRAELAKWLAPEPGHELDEHLYLIDPMGEWMMRFPVEFDPTRVKRDIDRLMRASASWDRAGR